MNILFSQKISPQSDALVTVCFEDRALTPEAQALDKEWHKVLSLSLEKSRFKGKMGEIHEVTVLKGKSSLRLVLLGLGKKEKMDLLTVQNAGGHLFAYLERTQDTSADIHVESLKIKGVSSADLLAHMAYGALLRSWEFTKYKTKKEAKEKQKVALKTLSFVGEEATAAKKSFQTLEAVAQGVFFTRELVTEPANVLYPETMTERLQSLTKLGVKVEVLDQKKLEKLGMGSLLSVSQGSAKEPRVVIMQWQGGKAKDAPLAFIGKGVTFDTGGISLKPAAGMWDMKHDMAGAGAVAGLMKALASRKAKVNVVGVVGLVENMPSGSATRPGDVVTSLSGQTIEILNTDAEGRLVLADVVWYTQDRFKPKFMVDLATLTGAIVIALGSEYAGLFANDEKLAENLLKAAEKSGEGLWRLPLGEAYDKALNSEIADVKNITTGLDGRKAGSTSGAQFIQRFVNNTPWAHLDIAGTAWAERTLPTCRMGASGFGVRLLNQLIEDFYEA